MTYKQPIKQILGSLLLLQIVSFGEVIINEISTKQTERAIRWDEKNQPFAGTWPAWWMIFFIPPCSWSLSDNENIPDKWKFPEGTIILPGNCLVR